MIHVVARHKSIHHNLTAASSILDYKDKKGHTELVGVVSSVQQQHFEKRTKCLPHVGSLNEQNLQFLVLISNRDNFGGKLFLAFFDFVHELSGFIPPTQVLLEVVQVSCDCFLPCKQVYS